MGRSKASCLCALPALLSIAFLGAIAQIAFLDFIECDARVAAVAREVAASRPNLLETLGVHVRPFTRWNRTLPCFPPENDWQQITVGKTPSRRGIFFVKNFKAGSSTGSSITLRIATNVARRYFKTNVCKNRIHHGTAMKMKYINREQTQSFLWTLLRDPTSRAISQFFHFQVTRRGVKPTDDNFLKFLNGKRLVNMQLNYVALESYTNEAKAINQVFEAYDFVGVTERMDESTVALQMLLGLELQDVMYVTASKSSGAFDDGRHKDTCFRIEPSVISPAIAEHIQSDEWKKVIYWDRVLHLAANKALDLTITKLGKAEFDRKLRLFRETQLKVKEFCAPKVVFPCNSTGPPVPMSETDCIHGDLGCGFDCLDEYFSVTSNLERAGTNDMQLPAHEHESTIVGSFINDGEEELKATEVVAVNSTSLPVPLQVLEQYKLEHSATALERNPNNRTYAVGFYSCPLQAGNRIHHFMNVLKWAIITNRTLLWKYFDEGSCNLTHGARNTINYRRAACLNANTVNECDKVLKRSSWIPSYDEWNKRLDLDEFHIFPWEATHAEKPNTRVGRARDPRLDLRGVDDKEKYPHQVAVFYEYRDKQIDLIQKKVRNRLLQTQYSRDITEKLHALGVDFMYGMLYRHSFSLQKELYPKLSSTTSHHLSDYSIAIHSRHVNEKANGCNINGEVACLNSFLVNVDSGQHARVWATVMSDRSCTIRKVKDWLEHRNVTVQVAEHDLGQSYHKEHGPFAGVGYFQDLEVASRMRSAFAGAQSGKLVNQAGVSGPRFRSSSDLVLEVIQYERKMDAWRAGEDPSQMKPLPLCGIKR